MGVGWMSGCHCNVSSDNYQLIRYSGPSLHSLPAVLVTRKRKYLLVNFELMKARQELDAAFAEDCSIS